MIIGKLSCTFFSCLFKWQNWQWQLILSYPLSTVNSLSSNLPLLLFHTYLTMLYAREHDFRSSIHTMIGSILIGIMHICCVFVKLLPKPELLQDQDHHHSLFDLES